MPEQSEFRCLNCGHVGLENSPGFPGKLFCPSCHCTHPVASVENWQWVFNDELMDELKKLPAPESKTLISNEEL